MARVAWVFDNYSWPVNPEEDSGWVSELVISNKVPIGGLRSRIQVGGVRSDVRQISGWIFGSNAAQHYQNMQNWVKNRTRASLVDHHGVSRQAMLIEFKPQEMASAIEWAQNRRVYKYNAVFLALD